MSPWYEGWVPEDHRAGPFRFVPLSPELVRADHGAVMASRTLLRVWSDSSWPDDGFTIEDNHRDLVWHQTEHRLKVAFTFSVLDHRSDQVVGCVYVRPVADSLRTRGVEPPDLDRPSARDACVRGWIRPGGTTGDLELIVNTIAWLTSPDWTFPAVWWQTNTASPEQLAACDAAGLTSAVSVPARPSLNWIFRELHERIGDVVNDRARSRDLARPRRRVSGSGTS